MRVWRLIVLIGFVFSIHEAALATIIYVPGSSSTIQGGINIANNGDTVLVADGIYYERISFLGKAITVASYIIIDYNPDHIQNTVIDADTLIIGVSDTGSVVRLVNGESISSVLQGFTIRNGIGTLSGSSERYGGGIYIKSSDVNVKDCAISGNTADYGGGLGCSPDPFYPTIQLSRSAIRQNSAASGAGYNGWGFMSIVNCIFEDSQDVYNPGYFSSDPALACSTANSRFYNTSFYTQYLAYLQLYAIDCYFDGGDNRLITFYLFNDSLMNTSFHADDLGYGSISNCQAFNTDITGHNFGTISINNSCIDSGSVFFHGNAGGLFEISNSTIISQGIDCIGGTYSIDIENTIIVTDNQPILSGLYSNVDILCCDFYGFGSTWLDTTYYPGFTLDTNNVYFENPLFFGSAKINPYTISSASICAPPHNACNLLIGAYGVGCGPPCDYVIGDVNGSDNYNGLDVTYGVAFLKGGSSPLCGPCPSCPGWYYCGDVNGSCSYNGLDITYGVAYLKGILPLLRPCSSCPPLN